MKCFCKHSEAAHKGTGGCGECSCTRFRDPALNGMTVRHAALKSHLSPSMLSRYLNGERRMSLAAHHRLAQTVGLSAEELYMRIMERRR